MRNERMTRAVPPASRDWRHPARRRPSDVVTDGREHFGHLPADTLQVDTTRLQAEIVEEVLTHLRQ